MSKANFMYGIPVPTDYYEENWLNGHFSPSCIHARSSQLVQFFVEQLFKDALAVYEWNVPDWWSKGFFLRVLYSHGFVVVFNADADGFGVIPMNAAAQGLNVFYEPKKMVVQNAAFRHNYELEIGKNCECIKLFPSWKGILDICGHYADLLALAYEAAGFNFFNSSVSYVFAASGNASAESFYKMFDKMTDGKPAVAVGKELFNKETGEPLWMPFDNDVGKKYIADKLLQDVQKLRSNFLTEIGVMGVAIEKKERLTNDEVAVSNIEAQAQAALIDETLHDSIDKVNKMFGINLSATRRENVMMQNDHTNTKEVQENE